MLRFAVFYGSSTTLLTVDVQRQAIEDRLRKKRLLATVDRVKSLRADVETAKTEQERKAAERLLGQAEALRKGLAGRRWGKHKVPEELIDVQLGEDLRPSLRELKVRSPNERRCLSIAMGVALMG